jgi:uncharacterized membrane protein
MRPKTILIAAALGGLLAASTGARAHILGYTFTAIYPPGAAAGTLVGNFNYGLNNLGQVVGGYQDSANNVHGYIYAEGKYVTFDAPEAVGQTTLNGINDLGQIVGVGDGETFLYNHGKFSNIANSNDFSPVGINDRSQILGFSPISTTGNFAVYTAGAITPLPTVPGAAFTTYSGFNNLGQFVGNYFEASSAPAFVETKGVFTIINDPAAGPGGFTAALGINDWGQIVGQYCDSSANNCHGFLDTNGHFTTIDDPSASPGSTIPQLINDVGQIFGFYSDSTGNFPSFLATPNFLSLASLAADPPAAAEASTWVMMLMGFAGLGAATYGRRRSKRHDASALAA